ncbi:MAG: nucleotidyltransferase [Myxococcota bacterium]
MNQDFHDMLRELSDSGAEFIVVGAYALAAHGTPRATGDIDIWVKPTDENAKRVYTALAAFGAPLDQLTNRDLVTPGTVFQIGVAPQRIDILTQISGVEFDMAWKNRLKLEVEGITVNVLGRADFIANKRASGRPKDLADIAYLEDAD